MARYIDAELFAKNLSMLVYMADDEDFTQAFVKGMQLVKDAENMTPTADVVPKSKYDLAVAEREANVKGFTETLNNIRSEVAEQIFEEIEKKAYLRQGDWHIHFKKYDELKKKYTEENKKMTIKIKLDEAQRCPPERIAPMLAQIFTQRKRRLYQREKVLNLIRAYISRYP